MTSFRDHKFLFFSKIFIYEMHHFFKIPNKLTFRKALKVIAKLKFHKKKEAYLRSPSVLASPLLPCNVVVENDTGEHSREILGSHLVVDRVQGQL